MKRNVLITVVSIVGLIAALIVYSVLSGKDKVIVLETEVQFGTFEIAVMVTGELQAIKETEIQAPSSLRSRNLRIYRVKIQDLIPEGTVVDSGQWVATLDRSEADNSLKDILDNLEKEESEYMRTKLDTTMQLRQLRDDLINLRFSMEEAEITLEQSQFEPPATIRQAEIELEKANRAYDQAGSNYSLKVRQAAAEIREAEINLARDRRSKNEMESVLKEFDIMAPASGMVIYKKDRNGQKRTAGTEISTWDLAVATLPDLSAMISLTYVNEIDISKLNVGQQVKVGVDAFPEKRFTGEVTEVANIGEQLPNTDAKVFEVKIEVNEHDTIMRPSMTTSNEVITRVLDSVLYIPLESVHANDSLTFVYTREGEKQIVVLGESNENNIIVEMGLNKGERLYMSLPQDPESYEYSGLNLIEEIKRRKEEEIRRREEASKKSPSQPGQQRRGRPSGTQYRRPQG